MTFLRRLLFAACVSLAMLLCLTPQAWAKDLLPRLGGEQQVNVRTEGSQTTPSIAADAEGNYAVTWYGPDGQGQSRIWVRLFDAAGTPRTGEIEVAQPGWGPDSSLKIAMAPDGRFVISWFDFQVAVFRLFDSAGHPRGEPTPAWDVAPANLYDVPPADVAMGPDGGFLLAFLPAGCCGSALSVRLFDQDGAPLEETHTFLPGSGGFDKSPRALILADGSYLVTWLREQETAAPLPPNDMVLAARHPAQPGPWSAAVQLDVAPQRRLSQLTALAHADGGFSVVWRSDPAVPLPTFPPPNVLRARRFNADGSPVGEEATLPWQSSPHPPALAEGRDGQILILADTADGSRPKGILFDRGWKELNFLDLTIVTSDKGLQREPALTRAKDGFVAAWSSGPPSLFNAPPPQDGSGFGIFAQRFDAPICVDGSRVLCLGNFTGSLDYGRFEVTVDWKTPDGATGPGRAKPLAWEAGDFWFFQEDNPELVVKVLDGRPLNGRFWVFSGALSDVDYTVHVVDTKTGVRRDYHNSQGQLASLADTGAFPEAGAAPGPSPASAGFFQGEPASSPLEEGGAAPLAACGEQVLCLFPGRELRVGVDFVDPRTGLHGAGKALPLTRNAGAFSFFTPGNLELIVKLLDGGPVNGKIWVFYGGLSDVDSTITVEDPASRATRTYHNARGQLVSRADTRAFNASSPLF